MVGSALGRWLSEFAPVRTIGSAKVAYLRKLLRLLPLHHKVIEPDATIDLGQYVTFPNLYRPLNPSMVRYGRDLLICVRGVAYAVHEKFGYYGNADGLPSLNRVFLLSTDLSSVSRPPLPQDRLDNLEDLKLFNWLGRVWAVGSLPVNDARDPNACTMTLVEFDTGLTDCRIIRLASPFGFPLEKNWAPFIADGALHFVYSCQPLVLLRYNPATSSVAFVSSHRHDRRNLRFLEGGSSGGIPTPCGTLFLTHRRVVRLPSRRRIYLNRIRRLSEDLLNLAAGPFFSIGLPGRGFRFTNGMLLDQDRVLITYGETDSAARLACFSAERFRRAVFPQT